jgi:hypothetical protein
MQIKVLTLAIVLLALLGVKSEAANSRVTPPSDDCPEVTRELAKLRSQNKNVRNQAKERIVVLSQNSAQLRQCVIRNMSDIVRAPRTFSDPALFLKYPELYVVWNEAVDILASIRAIETMQVLIDCIDCNDGPASLGLRHLPAATALVRFGEAAIPSLEGALTNSPSEIRRLIVMVLRDISGEKAQGVLMRRLKIEGDDSVASLIKNMLANWKELKHK